ncbi:MAG: mandelate racemase/muconate lactonizing enzyme family protein [Candidatus Latescibacterota bacterium]|jgi:muconate cycloisomerase
MKIVAVDIWTVVVPTIPGRVHSPEWVPETGWDQVPKHIVRLRTDCDLIGLGETGRGVDMDIVRQGAALLVGKDPERLALQDIYGRCGAGETVGTGPAYDAFEIAVCDLVGKARAVPVHALLGGAVRTKVRADYWMGQQTLEDSKRSVERALEHGFKGIKIKCQIEDPMVERLRAILSVGGVDFKVTVDPNERFRTAEQTIALAAELEVLGNVEVFEDPIPKTDVEGYKQIHEEINLPIAQHLGSSAAVLLALKEDLTDCFNLGGSLFGFQKNAAVAAAAGMVCWHGSGNDLGIIDTAYIHAAAAAPNCSMASDFVGSWTREDDLIVDPIRFEDGYVPTPDGPGLGCELDEVALARYVQAHEEIGL